MWITMAVLADFGGVWPTLPMSQSYRGRRMILRPDTERLVASVSIEVSSASPSDYDAGTLVIRRFLSAISWGHGWGYREHFSLGGPRLGRIGRGPLVPAYQAPLGRPRAYPMWTPEPDDPRALLSLALFREGLNERNPMPQYLSFYKILEVVARGRSNLIALAERHLPLARRRARMLGSPAERLDLPDRELAEYLYEGGRCAIAHAHQEPLVDPDDPADTRGVNVHVPLVRALAHAVMVEDLEIPPSPPRTWIPEWSELPSNVTEGDPPPAGDEDAGRPRS